MGYRPIEEYGLVGNADRCALIDRYGSIDWCCFPTISSPSVFGRLLDEEGGGHFSVQPTMPYDSHQTYLDRTNVLQTTFETRTGAARLTDFMPLGNRPDRPRSQRTIYRRLRCEEGPITVEVEFKPRFDYARASTRVRWEDQHVVATGDGHDLHLQAHGPLEMHPRGDRAIGTVTVERGQDIWLVTQHDHYTPRGPEACKQAQQDSVDWWHNWVGPLEQNVEELIGDEPWKNEVVRSSLVLKLLINENNGAIYAAPTTSLPESYGGDRNWDYRYNWMRDAKLTIQALFNVGQKAEAHRYFDWFRQIIADDPGDIQPVYGVHGENRLPERRLEHLSGYRHSAPVRVGNAAAHQHQLDVYGAIVEGMYETLVHDGSLSEEDWRSIRDIVDHVCEAWAERGEGIWEFRSGARHYVHSKLLCWVVLDRGIRLAEEAQREADLERWRTERQRLRETIEERGYSERAGAFVQHFETDEVLDATSLLIPIYGFLDPQDERVQNTIDTVIDELLSEQGFVYRTRGVERTDQRGAFLLCSFWLVNALVLSERTDEARELFERILEHVSRPSLLAERIDPRTGEYLGNYPQAFSHIGLINSAVYLGNADEDPPADA
jgi:GH15 family glucan-1,4-alpha-glucosidase